MGQNNHILEARGICKSYRLGATELKVLKSVDLAVRRGEFLAITGRSGSGKSTLLHILGALDKAGAGQVFFEGDNLSSYGASALNEFRNKKIGFVFQFYHLLDELDVVENVSLPAMASRGMLGFLGARKKIKKRAMSLLEQFGLSDRASHRPFELSGGERQRAAIARALMNEPRLLLADEPTGNLDLKTGNGILDAFEQLNRAGQTIVMVSHDEKIADRADRTITLADGKIVLSS